MMKVTTIGVAWYRPEDWAALKSMFVDSDKLQENYQDWLHDAEELEKDLSEAGHLVKRVHLDPKTFPGWCTLRGLRPDAAARSQFASEFVRLNPDKGNV
jgi:hypothetical protein